MAEWKTVPVEPTEEMLEAALDESGARCEAYTAPRESGVAIDSDMSEEDAAYINKSMKDSFCDTYAAMLAVSPPPPGAPELLGEALRVLDRIANWTKFKVRSIDDLSEDEIEHAPCVLQYEEGANDAIDTLAEIAREVLRRAKEQT